MREVLFFRRADGSSPVEEFIDGLTDKQAQKVAWVLKLIEDLDIIPAQYWKKLTNADDIWEARIQFGGNIFRILGFWDGKDLVILNHAFTKKSQKIPQKEIATAKKRKQDYFNKKVKK